MFFPKIINRFALAFYAFFLCIFTSYSTCNSQANQHIVATPLLQALLDDMKLYKLDAEGDQYLHAGDLYEHSVWTYNAMLELLDSNLPYVQNLHITERQKEVIALAALLHDIGKAGRKELFDRTHPKLHYDFIRNSDGSVNYITYYQDRQEHPRICFEYAAAPLKNKLYNASQRTYYMTKKDTASLVPFDMAELYNQLCITEEEQKLIAILLGIHYEFGNYKHGKITAEQFLTFLEKLVQEVDYNNSQLDQQIVHLAILIQAADVKGLAPVASHPSYLFPSGIECEPTHQPTKFANPFEALDYERKHECCSCSNGNIARGIEAMQELVSYFNTVFQYRSNSLEHTAIAY